jgi:hypothetical protein
MSTSSGAAKPSRTIPPVISFTMISTRQSGITTDSPSRLDNTST